MFQADICLFNFDNRNTLEQCVKSGHKTNMNGVNYFSDTNEKFLSDIKKIHSTSVDPGKCLPSLKWSKVYELHAPI